MINISTDETKYLDDELIIDNDSFFRLNVTARSFNEDSLTIMRRIDNAELMDENTGKIRTPYGECNIEDLSSGCKTVLNYVFIYENPQIYPTIKAINAIECGWNALEELFRLIERNEDDIEVLLQHSNNTYKCSDRDYCIDGKRHITSMFDF